MCIQTDEAEIFLCCRNGNFLLFYPVAFGVCSVLILVFVISILPRSQGINVVKVGNGRRERALFDAFPRFPPLVQVRPRPATRPRHIIM